MTADPKADILSLLKAMPDMVFTARQIAARCCLDTTGTCPEVRRLICELNMDGEPIVSNNKGFFYTEDEEALYKYRESLWFRAEAIIVRAHAITKTIRSLQNV